MGSLQGTAWDQLRQRDLKPFARLLPPALVTQAAQQAGVGLGRGPLHLGTLVWLALDGTTLRLDNWPRLQAHFGSSGNGRGRAHTQARLVMLQLPSVRLPWRYELTPLAEGERTVAGRLLSELRPDDLVLMDRGFWSYGAFW